MFQEKTQTFFFYKDNSLVYDLSFGKVLFFPRGGWEEQESKQRKSCNNNCYYYYYYCSIITKGAHSSYLWYSFNYGIQQFNEF